MKQMILLLLSLLVLSSCSAPLPVATNTDLGLVEVPPSSLSVNGENSEKNPQAPQENQASGSLGASSKTYTYLKNELSDGVYYLRFIKEYPPESSRPKEEYVIASDGTVLSIREVTLGFTYLLRASEITVLNDKEKTVQRFSLEGSEFDSSEFLDWTLWEQYENASYTVVNTGTGKKAKRTETFHFTHRNLSFSYSSDQLVSVSGVESDQSQWLCTVKELHGSPSGDLFAVPSNYTGK